MSTSWKERLKSLRKKDGIRPVLKKSWGIAWEKLGQTLGQVLKLILVLKSLDSEMGGGGIGRRARLFPGCLVSSDQWTNGLLAGPSVLPLLFRGIGGSSPSPPATS